MALLSSCCCCCSLRQGSIISAKYTMVYFTIFSCLSGTMVIQDVMNFMAPKSTLANSSDFNQEVAGMAPNSNLDTATDSSGGWQQNAKTMQSSGSSTNDVSTKPPEVVSVNTPKVKGRRSSVYFQAFSASLLGLDFIFEVAGIFVSMILLYGLRRERKALLTPWLVVVPFHTVLDVCQAINIMIDECQEVVGSDHDCRESTSSFTFLICDLGFNFLSIYIALVVYSQYQEYEAGRGTAAYDGLMTRHSDASNYVMNPTSVNSSHRNSQSQNQQRRSYGFDKSDLWCDGLMMERVNDSSPTTKVSSISGDRETAMATTSGGHQGSTSTTPSASASASTSTDPTRGRQRFVQIDLTDDTNETDPELLPNPLRKPDEERGEFSNHRVGQCVRFDCEKVQFENESPAPRSSAAKRNRIDHHPRRNSAVHTDRKGTPSRASAHLLSVPTAEAARRTSAPSLKQNRSGSLNV